LYWISRALVVAALSLTAAEASAAPRESQFRANRIEVKYLKPNSPDHQRVLDLLVERQALEKMRDLLSPFRLPRTLIFQTSSCNGTANAWFDGKSVTVCYELVAELLKNMPKTTTPTGVAAIDTVIGPFVHVFLHEAGHALFDLLNIPVLGAEEDAADRFATDIMLRFEKDEARRLITGTAYQYKAEMSSPTVTMLLQKFSDEHSTGAQRFYDLLCMAYGADRKLFGDFVSAGHLPEERAELCRDEYARTANAFAALFGRYVDPKVAARQPKRWLEPVDAQAGRRRLR
jgi:hypothetical protein